MRFDAQSDYQDLTSEYLFYRPHVWVGQTLRLCPVFPKWFIRKYKVDESTGCWNWTGWLSSNLYYPAHKYGYTKYVDTKGKRRSMSAHRYAYTLVHGPVPRDLDVDHLCHNKLCVNPAHLEAVSHKENINRIPEELRHRDSETHRRIALIGWQKRRRP